MYGPNHARDHRFKKYKKDEIVQRWKAYAEFYVSAGEYDIAGPKEVSAVNFKTCFDRPAIFAEVGLTSLNDVVSTIYGSTSKNDANQHLRRVVAKQTQLYIAVLQKIKEFKDVVKANREFGSDAIRAATEP